MLRSSGQCHPPALWLAYDHPFVDGNGRVHAACSIGR
ncbi:MAG: Fic family protein [Phycisphaerales bacterium]|nr:Fic family protein [Phycisphaerales bacterium]